MKDYKEIAQEVLRRGAEEISRNKKRQRMFLRGGCTVAVAGLFLAVCATARYGGKTRQEAEGQLAALNPTGISGAKDTGNPGTGYGAVQGSAGLEGTASVDFSGLDKGQGGFTDVDGDPAGYGSGSGSDPSGHDPAPDGDPSGYDPSGHDPVPGGNPSGYEVAPGGKTDGELDPESIMGGNSVENAEFAQQGEKDAADDGGKASEGTPGNETGTAQPTEMISSYPEDAVYCYAAPENGEVFCSVPLKHAMEEYGDGVLYRVVVDLFCDGEEIRPESGEAKLAMEGVIELGYTVLWENCDNGGEVRRYYILHATRQQLTEFDAGEEYGYVIRFFDES